MPHECGKGNGRGNLMWETPQARIPGRRTASTVAVPQQACSVAVLPLNKSSPRPL